MNKKIWVAVVVGFFALIVCNLFLLWYYFSFRMPAVDQLPPVEQELPDHGGPTTTSTEPLITIPTSTEVIVPTSTSSKRPQFVVLSFDGSYSIKMWQDTRKFARDMSAQGKPVHFTYFISGVYFLTPQYKTHYTAPHQKSGASAIGFALNEKDIYRRTDEINAAVAEGHEIGSHANGHFDGSKWTYEDWKQEFNSFNDLVFNSFINNNFDNQNYEQHTLKLVPQDIIGFRAPVLGVNTSTWKVLNEFGFKYDASGVGKPTSWPVKTADGLWRFPLASIAYTTSTRKILSMDYNFYLHQSQGKDVASFGSDLWNQYYDEMYSSYMNYFMNNYKTNHAPVIIGHHFSLWNDGVYWEVMKNFAREVCGKPDVKCVSFAELTTFLESQK
jgi:hypothetical protein